MSTLVSNTNRDFDFFTVGLSLLIAGYVLSAVLLVEQYLGTLSH